MQAVQTFWTNADQEISALTGGWPDVRFHLMSWALSSSLLKKNLGSVALYTDQKGKQLLIDELDLPFDHVYLTQEGLGQIYSRPVWVMRKMHTYAQVNEPFIHVDGDAFLWQPLPDLLTECPIFVQNFQSGFLCYPTAIKELKALDVRIPDFLPDIAAYEAVNMGIVGGCAYTLFHSFYVKMEAFVQKNQHAIIKNVDHLSVGFLNTLLEECFFYYYTRRYQKPITAFIQEPMNGQYTHLSNIIENRYKYAHIIGENKNNLLYCQQVENKLSVLFPDVYQRAITFLAKHTKSSGKLSNAYLENPFVRSNYIASTLNKKTVLTPTNYLSSKKKLLSVKDDLLRQAVTYESEKFEAVKVHYSSNKLTNTDLDKAFFLEDYLCTVPVENRLYDTIQYDGKQPIFARSFEHNGQQIKEYVSLVYDEKHGFSHVDECLWDQLALFILCQTAEKPVTLQSIITSLSLKMQSTNLAKETDMRQRMETRINELFMAGLLRYQRNIK